MVSLPYLKIILDFWVLRHKADQTDNPTVTGTEIPENSKPLKQHPGTPPDEAILNS